jgi:hypothetical protein
MLAFIDNSSKPEVKAQEEAKPETKIEEKPAGEQEKMAKQPTTFFDYLLYTLVGVVVLLSLVTIYLIIQVSNLLVMRKKQD